MKNIFSHLINLKIAFIIMLTCGVSFICTAQKPQHRKLYTSTIFTLPKSFTNEVEGPATDKSGIVYAVNFSHQGTIGEIAKNGTGKIFVELPEGSVGNGIRFNRHGDMLIADYTLHSILEVDMVSKKIKILAHEPTMNQPNDIAIDSKDRLYASDPNWKDSTGKIWRIDPDGRMTLLEQNIGTVNGIEVSPDEKKFYVNESVQRKVWVYDLSPAGTISNKRLLIKFPDYQLDGMRCDINGNLYIARYSKGTIVKVSPAGKIMEEIILHGKEPSNIAFGGKDGRTVYVTVQDQGNLEMFRVDTPGREWKMMRNN
jgi:sugar lactone lactonase YvrE